MSIEAALAVAIASIAVVWLLVIERLSFVIHRQFCVKRLYLRALVEAFDDQRVGLVHARTKTPSLRKFRR